MTDPLNEDEITRYARQLILPQIGDEGQDALKATRLGIIGAGGLGNPALIAAATAGFGHITICDDDLIEPTNLNRQFLFTPNDIGKAKAQTAAQIAQDQNPHITLTAQTAAFDNANAVSFMHDHDIIIDASDNAKTRYLANSTALATKTPLIFVSAIRFEGQLALFVPQHQTDQRSACYQCLFPLTRQTEHTAIVPNCATVGIAGPVTMMMGALAVLEAMKFVTKAEGQTSLAGKLLLFDGLACRSDVLTTKRDKNCPACAHLS